MRTNSLLLLMNNYNASVYFSRGSHLLQSMATTALVRAKTPSHNTAALNKIVKVCASLQTRGAGGVNVGRIGGLVGLEGRALIAEGGAEELGGVDLGWSFDVLKGQTAVNVPDDVAVHQPRAWVVGLEADNCVAGWIVRTSRASKHGSITWTS
jgi:hypothetical protein